MSLTPKKRKETGKQRRKREYAERIERRRMNGHICATCASYGCNTHYKFYGGKPILPNQCIQPRRSSRDPLRLTRPDSGCIMMYDMWKQAED